MHTMSQQVQIDEAVEILQDHAARCGELSAARLCADSLGRLLASVEEIRSDGLPFEPPPRRGRSGGVSADAAARVIQSTLIEIDRIASDPNPRSFSARSSAPPRQSLSQIWQLAEDRSLAKFKLFAIAGAAAELLSYVSELRYPSGSEVLPFDDVCIVVGNALVNTVYDLVDPEFAEEFCDVALSHLEGEACARAPRSNPTIIVEPREIPSKDLRSLVRTAVDQGFVLERLSAGHFRVRHPDLPGMVVFSSSGDPRAIKNTKSHLKKLGVIF